MILMNNLNENLNQAESLIQKIKSLEQELEAEFAKRRAALRFGIEHGRARFEEEVLRRHKELRVGLLSYITQAQAKIALTAFVIYPLILPLVFLDICVSLYQAICFPAYGIQKVKRREYFVFDHQYLAYLNILQKINCAYCSYANGLIGYVREVAGRTEAYWCPVKHARRVIGAHEQYLKFADYGDADAFRGKSPVGSVEVNQKHNLNS